MLKKIQTALLLGMIALPVQAQNITEKRVQFAGGSTGTVISDKIKGDETVDYVLGAAIGQRMTVDMTTSNPSAYFNLMLSGAPEAIHIGSVDGLHYSGSLPAGGDWVIRVFLMRNAARRGETADYTIKVNIDGAAAAASPASGPEAACKAAVVGIANTSQVEVVGSEFSEAGTMVRLTVGPDRAPWQCIGYKDGSTAGVMFLGDDSAGVPQAPAPDYADGDAGGPDWWKVVVSGSLTVRSGPGAGNAAIGKAANGQRLRNLGCQGIGNGRWCHVEVDDGAYRGWVAGRYLVESGAPTASTAPTPATPAPSGTKAAEDACKRALAQKANASVRDIVVFDVLPSEAGIGVMMTLAGAEKPWSCLADSHGNVQGLMYTGEG